jgi:PAS domain S-box-containing protein
LADVTDDLATLLQASHDGVLAIDADGLIVLASRSVKALFGYEPEEIVGQPLEILVPEAARTEHEGHRRSFVEAGRPRPMGRGLALRGRRRDGTLFPVDVSLAPFPTAEGPYVGAFVRDITERHREETRLHAINEITQRLLAGEPTETTLELVASRARGLVDGALGCVLVPYGADHLIVSASDGYGAESARGVKVEAETSIARRAMVQGKPISVPDLSVEAAVPPEIRALGLGPGLYCPLSAEEEMLGALVVARHRGEPEVTPGEIELIEVFANAAAVALTLGEARFELEQLNVSTEHERIARDLHDTVIQRLFALGMGLQNIERVTTGSVAERIDHVVDGLDEVIRDIRDTIFHLERPVMGNWGLRSSVIEVATAAAEQLGFAPRVRFQGPVDSVTDEELGPEVVAVLTEVLSNVARHAKASSVEVVVAAEDGVFLVSVADDGVGLPEGRTAGNGLRNIAARARALSGSVSITARSPAGTLVEWTVPLRS